MATPSSKPQTIAFVPQGVNVARASRSLPIGALVEATNVRQVKEDEWRKRPGFDRDVPSVDSSAYGNASQGDSVYAGALVERDLAGQFWSYDDANNTRRYRGFFGSGAGQRPFPSYQSAGIPQSPTTVVDGPRRSQMVLGASSDQWVFTVGQDQFQFTIFGSNGTVRKAVTTQSSTAIQQIAPVYDPINSVMWALALNATGTTVTSYKFDSTGLFVNSFSYHAGLVGGSTIDAKWLSSPGEMAVAVAQYDTATPRCRVTQSYLNPSTGQPRAAPAATNFDITPNANRPDTCGGVRILVSSGATSWYYAFWRASATANTLDLVLNTVTTSTLANGGAAILTSLTTAAGDDYRGVTSGYVDTGTGNRVVFAHAKSPTTAASGSRTYDSVVARYTFNGASTTSLTVARGAWLASDPVLVGSNWYFATGRDAGYNVVPAAYGEFHRQGDLYLRESAGAIVSQVLQGNGPCWWHRPISLYNETAGVQANAYDQSVTALLSPATNKIALACGRTGELLQAPEQIIVGWDFAATYGSPVAIRDTAIFPGPIPLAVGPRQTARELFPLHSPPVPRVTLGAAGASGVASVCCTYRFIGPDGEAYETAPGPAFTGTYFFNDSSITCPTLKHIVGGVRAQVCMYATAAGGSIFSLQRIIENDPSVNEVAFGTIWPVATDFPQFVALHTNGGGLSHAPAPPCRSVALWRDRLHLSGTTTDGEVWHSQEITEGAAPDLNEALRSFWNDAQGPILGMRPVDWNYLAALKRNGVGVAGGPGPDGRGLGAYSWQTLTTEKGLYSNGRHGLLSTPFGVAFQNDADGRICLVTTGLQVQDIMQGADTYRATAAVAAVLNEGARQAWFYLSSGTILVLEYAWAGEAKALKECWRTWSSANLLRAYGAVMTPGLPIHIETSGAVKFPIEGQWVDVGASNSSNVNMALETGRLAPFGLLQEGAIAQVHILGQHITADNIRVSITPDNGSASVHDIATSSLLDYSMKPAGCFRCKEVRVRIEETDSVGSEGVVFEGVALDVVPFGRSAVKPVAQRIA